MPIVNVLQQGMELKFNPLFVHSYSTIQHKLIEHGSALLVGIIETKNNVNFYLHAKLMSPAGEVINLSVFDTMFDKTQNYYLSKDQFYGAERNKIIKEINSAKEQIVGFIPEYGMFTVSKLIKHPEWPNKTIYLNENGGDRRLPQFQQIVFLNKDLLK